jgi:hypothetical protein
MGIVSRPYCCELLGRYTIQHRHLACITNLEAAGGLSSGAEED